ncbi:RraA family protein [Pseudomonas sp. NPDC007930]|uniref:RraA family protein n=1 Tax=Pseudomonas sp. NPDC007930 TaxID=3364417 RepID=UPI0036E8204D
MTVGFRVLPRTRQVSAEQVERFRALPVANISDSMARMAAAGAALRPMHRGGVLAGPALTVKCRPGDNLMLHYAMDIAAPGDVLVVDAGGDLTNAMIGELMTTYAEHKGLGGFVINGAIRDSRAIAEHSLPVYAAGVTHRGPYKDGPGEVNVAVAINGMVIEPGDLIIGDEDGLLCVPFAELEAVYAKAKAKSDAEHAQLAAIAAGRSDRRWVIEALRARQCLLPEGPVAV